MGNGRKDCGACTILFSFLMGGVLGTVLGILITPQTVEEARKKLSSTVASVKKTGDELLEKMKEKLSCPKEVSTEPEEKTDITL